MKAFNYILSACLILFSLNCTAGKDPIGWTQTGTLPASTAVGETYSVVYTFTNNLPFTMPSPLYISPLSNSKEFTYVDHCSGTKLAPNQSCSYVVILTITTPGLKTTTVRMEYGKNIVPLPKLTTTASGNQPSVNVTGLGIPPSFTTEVGLITTNLQFVFTNNGNENVTATSVQASSPGFTQTNTTCNSPIAPQHSCTVTGSYSNQTAGNYILTATYNYTNSSGNQSATAHIQAIVKNQGTVNVTGVGLPQSFTTEVNTTTPNLKFEFTNNGTESVTATSVQASSPGFTQTSTTCNSPIPPQQTCTVAGSYSSPQTAGNYTLTATYNYTNSSGNQSATAHIQAIVKNQGTVNVTGAGSPQSFSTETGTTTPNLQFIFTNNSEVSVTATSVQANSTGFTQTNSNCNAPIAPHQFCTVTGSFSTQTVGNYTLTATYNYTNSSGNQSAIAYIQATVKAASPTCTQVLGLNRLPLPLTTYAWADNVVEFTFVNTCAAGTPAINLGTVNVTGNLVGGAVTATKGPASAGSTSLDNCSNQSLSPGQICQVFASIIPQGAGTLNATATVNVSVGTTFGTATANTNSSTVLVPPSTIHNIYFVNQCDFPVWYGIANGTGVPFPSNSVDPTPLPNSPNQYLLAAQAPGQPPAFKVLAVGSYENGSIWPRTGCQMLQNGQFRCVTGSCQTNPNTAQCVNPNQGQPTYEGALDQPKGPYTKLESFISNQAGTDGIYDVSLINGFNVPTEFKGLGPQDTTLTPPINWLFSCGAAGAIIQPPNYSNAPPAPPPPLPPNPPSYLTGLANCPWTFTPPTTGNVQNPAYFQFVTPAPSTSTINCSSVGTPCSADGSLVCGETFQQLDPINVGNQGNFTSGCGAPIGYWTPVPFMFTNNQTYATNSPDLSAAYGIFDSSNTNPSANYGYPPLGPPEYGANMGPDGSYYFSTSNPQAKACIDTPTVIHGAQASLSDLYGCTPTTQVDPCTTSDPWPPPIGNGSTIPYRWVALNTGYFQDPNAQQFNFNMCGCYDWDQSGSQVLTAQTHGCWNVHPPSNPTMPNPTWIRYAFPIVAAMKQTCPTAYAFQFDDASVSFSCNPYGNAGYTSYQITFCPGGKTGAPGT